MTQKLIIATRESRLALWQANFVKAQLMRCHPDLTVELLGMTTRGDQILDQSLSKIGGKGLFVKELEAALADGRSDLAVHSLKDVPMTLPDGFTLSCVMTREDAHDAFISNQYANLSELPYGAVVGTSSLRRAAQIKHRYPHLTIESLRGNLDTRLRKLDEGQYDAIILAAAGVKRLDMAVRIKALLSLDESLPSAGQGALGIEIADHREDVAQLLKPLQDVDTTACTEAERAVSRALGGSCQTPLAAHAVVEAGQLFLRASLAMPDGSRVLHSQARGALTAAQQLGEQVVRDLYTQGAQEILDHLSSAAV